MAVRSTVATANSVGDYDGIRLWERESEGEGEGKLSGVGSIQTSAVRSSAAAGVRARTVAMLRRTRGENKEGYVLLGVHRAR